MAGFGSQPFGSSPYGIGTPAVATELGGKLFQDAASGEQTGSRKIDPLTRDYEINDYGRIAGMSNVKQLVLLAVSTKRGSSAMRELGQELQSIERITSNFARRVDTTLRRSVQHLVDRGLITVIDTTVEIVRPGVARARLRWRDISTGEALDTFTDL